MLEAAVFLLPKINFLLADADCIPLALFEVGELRALASHLAKDARRNDHLGAVLLVSEPHAEINAGWICVEPEKASVLISVVIGRRAHLHWFVPNSTGTGTSNVCGHVGSASDTASWLYGQEQ